jgi:hypothetical protein
MRFTNLLVAAAAAVTMVDAAPHARAARPSIKASEIKSWVLNSWGPMEPLSTKGDLIILDANLQSAATIKQQKAQGKKVICYISAGSIENWRSDAKEAMSTVSLGKKYKGFEATEQWVNLLEWQTAKPIMESRINQAASKGCDGVEFDNIDCHDHGPQCVPGASKEQLRKKQVEYIRWLSQRARSKGLAVGLKNVNGIVDQVVQYGDFAIEEANPASEFAKFGKFIAQNKAVLSVHYHDHGGKICALAKQNNMLTKYKSRSGWKNCF